MPLKTVSCVQNNLSSSKFHVNQIKQQVHKIDYTALLNRQVCTGKNQKVSVAVNPDYKFYAVEANNTIESYFSHLPMQFFSAIRSIVDKHDSLI